MTEQEKVIADLRDENATLRCLLKVFVPAADEFKRRGTPAMQKVVITVIAGQLYLIHDVVRLAPENKD